MSGKGSLTLSDPGSKGSGSLPSLPQSFTLLKSTDFSIDQDAQSEPCVLGEGFFGKVRHGLDAQHSHYSRCPVRSGVCPAPPLRCIVLAAALTCVPLSTALCSPPFCWRLQVYRGKLGVEPAAIKVLKTSQLGDLDREQFLKEVAILKSCRWVQQRRWLAQCAPATDAAIW